MKGVTKTQLGVGDGLTDQKQKRSHLLGILGGVFAGLFLSSVLWTSGLVSAIPFSDEVTSAGDGGSPIVMVFGTVRLEIEFLGETSRFTYLQGGVAHHITIRDQAGLLAYSLNEGPWELLTLPLRLAQVSESQEGLPENPDGSSFSVTGSRYWWDGVRFVRGYPVVYPHPERDFYYVYPRNDWNIFGYRLLHYQFGTAAVGLLANLGPLPLGAAIGAVIGSVLAPGIGTLIGAIAGTVIGGILAYAYNVAFLDEAGTIWWWINRSLFTALGNAPWWLWWCGPCMQAYIAGHIDYLRIGSWTGYNQLGVWGP